MAKLRIPLSEHPDMKRLAEILKGLPEDRQAACMDMLEREGDQDSSDEEEGTAHADER
jgi:hypothetical protein